MELALVGPHGGEAAGLEWLCRGIVFSWRDANERSDAADIFARVFGYEASRVHRRKFPTMSMPCRSWANGVSEGLAADVRIGVDGDRSEIRLNTEAEAGLSPGAVSHFKAGLRRLEVGSTLNLAVGHVTLDLELAKHADPSMFVRWLTLPDWQARASVLRQEYVFALAEGGAEASVVAFIDHGVNLARLVLGVTSAADVTSAGSSRLFERLDGLLRARSVTDLVAL